MPSGKKSPAGRKPLLIELGTEELPPKSLKSLSRSFAETFTQGLAAAGLIDGNPTDIKVYATPRRLAVQVGNVLAKQPDRVEEKRGPALQAAYDQQGEATSAAHGFARSCGVPLSALKTRETTKGAWLVFEKKLAGDKLDAIVQRCLHQTIKALPIAKRMRWGEHEAEFVRPVHWLLALYGSDLVRVEVLGLKSDRTTRGHRFHSTGELEIPAADEYPDVLKTDGRVIADYDERQAVIKKQAKRLIDKTGQKVVIGQNLLDEVTALVEWPVALVGKFDQRFLQLPQEVLISTMAGQQKYFHVVDDDDKLAPMFVTISNIKSKSPKRVRRGNERVLRARLSDAWFFWEMDQEIDFEDQVEKLEKVLFHNRLGSVYDKTERIRSISGWIAGCFDIDAKAVDRAATLCKADLVTTMVGEFPELQGVIGKYYADNRGIDKPIADAIEAHYKPRTAAHPVPSDPVAICIALADRADSLVGLFACGEAPSGDKDPFALRRAALGVFRIMVENRFDLDLQALYKEAAKQLSKQEKLAEKKRLAEQKEPTEPKKLTEPKELVEQVYAFTMERSRVYFQLQGYSADEHAAVSAARPTPTSAVDFARRIEAVHGFFNDHPDAAQLLVVANKRITNMLPKVSLAVAAWYFNPALACDPTEKELADKLDEISDQVHMHFKFGDYAQGLTILAKLKNPVDRFFDNVMVMHEDELIRNNRLSLLARISHLFSGVADISKIRIKP